MTEQQPGAREPRGREAADQGRRRGGNGPTIALVLAVILLVVIGIFVFGGAADDAAVDDPDQVELDDPDLEIDDPDIEIDDPDVDVDIGTDGDAEDGGES